MQIEIKLKELLEKKNLMHRGIINQMADDLGVHRHTISALFRSDGGDPSVWLLSRLIGWLRDKGVPASELPHALIGLRPDALWEAISRTAGVAIYVAEYREEYGDRLRLWVSRRDAVLASAIIEELHKAPAGAPQPAVHTHYVPFHFRPTASERDRHRDDEIEAQRTLDQLEKQNREQTPIIIGSQEVNYLLEVWIAKLFGCRPFEPSSRRRVPIYMRSRNIAQPMRSCFGGLCPPGFTGDARPGIYYLKSPNTWALCPWESNRVDAGVVLVVRDASAQTMQMALFGYSGRGTEAMASRVVRQAAPFWPPYYTSGTRTIGLYVCSFELPEETGEPTRVPATGRMDICRVGEDVLKHFI